jgi:Haloacid dehalogenase-like hydrolase
MVADHQSGWHQGRMSQSRAKLSHSDRTLRLKAAASAPGQTCLPRCKKDWRQVRHAAPTGVGRPRGSLRGLTGEGRLINHYFDAFPRFFLYDDVVRTLDRLSRRYRLAVVSNIDDDLLALTPLRREFDLVCTAQQAKGYKPDGAPFRYLIEHAGCVKEEILHVGQSQFTDLIGGKPLGLTIAWINRRQVLLDDSVPRPDFIFADIQSLNDLVEL